jgi:general secretion pathway protein H
MTRAARRHVRGPSPDFLCPAKRGGGGGFTLIELLIVIAVIGLMSLAVAPALGTLTGANAREAAGRLAGGMRFLFDTAALRHTTCRMALDPANRTWSAQCCEGATAAIGEDAKAAAREEEELARRFPDEKDEQVRKLLAKTGLGSCKDLADKRELPGHAKFGKLHIEGAPEADELAYVYFFAGGQAQRAYVPVVDGSNVFTVVVEPFTGRARVVAGAVEVKE